MQKLSCVRTRQHPLPVWIISSQVHHRISTNSQPFLVGIVSSSIATAMAPKLTTYIASRSSDCQVGGRAIGVYVGGGEPVGTYRVVEAMGITNFTMVVPTVQSSRAPLEGHRLGWVGGKLWTAVDGGDGDIDWLEVGQSWGDVRGHVSPGE